jgi:hypothetical protein
MLVEPREIPSRRGDDALMVDQGRMIILDLEGSLSFHEGSSLHGCPSREAFEPVT